MTIDERINQFMAPLSDAVSSVVFFSIPVAGTELPLIVVWLAAGGIVFTLYLRFVNIRGFRRALRIVSGGYHDPAGAGEVTHFQALSAALSGTVGLGNIAGVAVAVSLGGPGATFWMIVAGFLSMALKFAECTLAVKYRHVSPDGRTFGGPMYYLNEGLAKRGWPRLGRGAAAFFSICCIFGAVPLFSINQSFQQFSAVTGFDTAWIFGVVMAVIVGLVIMGGIRSIANVTKRLVPLMCGVYMLAALFVLLVNYGNIPAAIELIFSGAFAPDAVAGGAIGVMIQGFRRAAFSSEAGLGSAPIAHSAVKTSEPVTEGLVALLEPFIDTVVVCTTTALVIVVTGVYNVDGIDGVSMTSAAFASVISWFPLVLTVAVILFAFSTVISWAYYGMRAWTYLVGDSERSEAVYKVLYLSFVMCGAVMDLGAVVNLADSILFAMAIPNILGCYILAPEIKRELEAFMSKVDAGVVSLERGRRPV